MKLPNWLKKRAELSPDRIAVIEGENEHTFVNLLDDVKVMISKISALGLNKGDHVALAISNRYVSVVMIHAMQSLGIIMVLLNTRLTAREMIWQIENSNSKLFIYDEVFSNKISQAKSIGLSINALTIKDLMELSLAFNQENLLNEFDLDDVHSIIYTSGTTGNPKGVMLTNGNHWWSATGSALNLGLDIQDRWLACLPLFHVSGLSILMRSVIYGMTIILHEGFDAKKVNQAIEKQKVTIVSVVSIMLQKMLDELGEQRYPQSLRCVLLGGGPAPKPILEESRVKNIPVFQTYGMTETASQIVTLAPEYMLNKVGSAGKPLFPSQLRIEKDKQEAEPNEVGEIVVKGPNVTAGYYQRTDKTLETIQNGWLYTGDLGYVDEDGFLFVIDRRTDLIISGGENIYPAEIESVLIGHSAVKEAGVIGAPHDQWGQAPIAFIVTNSDKVVSEQELKEHCEKYLARYKIPKKFYTMDQLPRNAANKLVRRKLHEIMSNVEGMSHEN